MSRVKSLETIQILLQQALDKTETLHEKQEEIENPTDASERTTEVCEELAEGLRNLVTIIDDAVADLTP